nr:NUDIX domain-containing protein [Ferrimicrobium acidiphilum]
MSATTDVPEVIVIGVVVNNGLVLLTQSQKWHDKYSIPGGHVQKGETAFAALKREIREETGMVVKAADLVYVADLINPDEYYLSGKHFVVLMFRCFPKTFKVRTNKEAYRYQWLPISEFPEYPLTNPAKTALGKMNGPPIEHFGD